MIIDLHLNNIGLAFGQLPDLYLSDTYDYEICIASLYVKFEHPIKDNLIILSSTLVDRSSINPNQALLTLYNDDETKNLFHQPTHLSWYKLQCYRIGDSVFNLQLEKQHENTKIEKLHLQLRIRRICKDSVRH